MKFIALLSLSLVGQAFGHYTFPHLIVNGVVQPSWQNVRKTDNYYDLNPVEDVKNINLRCYTSQTNAKATTIDVPAGSSVGFAPNKAVYHEGTLNVYMAKVPSGNTAVNWDGAGTVWFKVHQIPPKTDGGSSITYPTDDLTRFEFRLPQALPSGEYLVRVEHIALQDAARFGGAQFYHACGQINVTGGGGSGTPGPLVAIPGVYNGNEPGINIDIYWPIPVNYVQPGPAVWRG